MKQNSFVFLIFIFSQFSFSQHHSISGKVSDEKQVPLENAHVHTGSKFVLTAADGTYTLKNVPKGEHLISVSYIGFKTVDTLIVINDSAEVNFNLSETTAALEEVVLSGNTHRTSSVNVEKVNQEYLRENYSGSLANTLEKLPGVNAVEIGAGSSKPIIRGLGFNRVAVTENGIKQEGQQWGADHGLEIDAFSVENIEIIKGVGAIEHGSDAIGGVIKIINDKTPKIGFSGEAIGYTKSVNNTIASSFNLAYRPGKFFYKIKATGSEFGDYSIPTDNIIYLNRNIPIHNEKLKNTAGKELDLYAQVGYMGDHYKGTLSISNVYFKSGFFPGAHGIPSIDRVRDDEDQRNIEYPFQRVNHIKIISKNEWFFHDYSWEVTLGMQNNHRQEWSLFHTHYTGQTAPQFNPNLELNFSLNTFDAQIKYSKDWNSSHSSSLGLQGQFQDNNISGFNFLLPEFDRSVQAFYARHSYQASNNTELSLGARFNYSRIRIADFYDFNLFDYLAENGYSAETADAYATRSTNTERNFVNFNVMGGILHNLGEYWDLSLNVGTSFRLPTAIELGANGIHHGSFRHEQGDPTLDAEKGAVVDTRADFRKGSFSASLSPYVYYFDNYIFLNPSGEFSILPHAGQIYKFTQGSAFLTGFELDVNNVFREKWHTKITLEYLYNRQINSDRARNFPLPFTPPINGFVEIGYEFLNEFDNFNETRIFANATMAMEQDRIAQNEKATPGYQIFGGGLRTDLNLNRFNASVSVQVMNIFNLKYFNHTNFYRALEIPEMGRNIQVMIKIPVG